ncbi:MAG TPA: hypothetical protein DEP57_08035 [Selenomonas sp.]|nr:hypothetical protein [Selenomonas sp.]
MCRKELETKVKECGAAYGMGIYSDGELLSLATGIDPDKFSGNVQETFDNPRSIDGIGKRKELAVFAVRELSKRLLQKKSTPRIIHGPEDAAAYVQEHLALEKKEHFCEILLNTKNHIIGWQVISVGSLTASVVHPREVFAPAVLHHAAAIIVAHNHPSGDPTPSREDIQVTQRLVKAGKIMDIQILDHIIIGDNRFVSMKEKGLVSNERTSSKDGAAEERGVFASLNASS